jgi:hypothetical protein
MSSGAEVFGEGLNHNGEVSELTPVGGPEIVTLNNQAGYDRLQRSLLESQGKAMVVVHPFFPEGKYDLDFTESAREGYEKYKNQLRQTVQDRLQRGMTLIVFEGLEEIDALPAALSKMGVENGPVYIVPTSNDDESPVHADINQLSQDLKELGLEKAVVLGSYLWVERSPAEGSPNLSERLANSVRVPNMIKRFKLEGCVGYIAKALLKAGIYPVISAATYPRRSYGDGVGKSFVGDRKTIINKFETVL